MINKIAASAAEAVADVRDGSTVLEGGFGSAGIPNELIEALIEQGACDLTVVNNNAGNGNTGLAALLAASCSVAVPCRGSGKRWRGWARRGGGPMRPAL